MKNIQKELMMTKQKYYTQYSIRPVGARAHEKYEFQLRYFLSGKEILHDADMKYTETVVCAAADREKQERFYTRRINNTVKRLEIEIRRMGANALNARILLDQKMR